MLFSTKAEYGVRLMVELGRQPNTGPVSLNAIAEAERLPLSYLEHLVAKLRQALNGFDPIFPFETFALKQRDIDVLAARRLDEFPIRQPPQHIRRRHGTLRQKEGLVRRFLPRNRRRHGEQNQNAQARAVNNSGGQSPAFHLY